MARCTPGRWRSSLWQWMLQVRRWRLAETWSFAVLRKTLPCWKVFPHRDLFVDANTHAMVLSILSCQIMCKWSICKLVVTLQPVFSKNDSPRPPRPYAFLAISLPAFVLPGDGSINLEEPPSWNSCGVVKRAIGFAEFVFSISRREIGQSLGNSTCKNRCMDRSKPTIP